VNPKGIYVAVGGPHGHWFGGMFRMLTALFAKSGFTSRKLIIVVVRPNQDALNLMRELMAAGKVTSVIEECAGRSGVGVS